MDTDALRWLQQVTDGTTLTEVSELIGNPVGRLPGRGPAGGAIGARCCALRRSCG